MWWCVMQHCTCCCSERTDCLSPVTGGALLVPVLLSCEDISICEEVVSVVGRDGSAPLLLPRGVASLCEVVLVCTEAGMTVFSWLVPPWPTFSSSSILCDTLVSSSAAKVLKRSSSDLSLWPFSRMVLCIVGGGASEMGPGRVVLEVFLGGDVTGDDVIPTSWDTDSTPYLSLAVLAWDCTESSLLDISIASLSSSSLWKLLLGDLFFERCWSPIRLVVCMGERGALPTLLTLPLTRSLLVAAILLSTFNGISLLPVGEASNECDLWPLYSDILDGPEDEREDCEDDNLMPNDSCVLGGDSAIEVSLAVSLFPRLLSP